MEVLLCVDSTVVLLPTTLEEKNTGRSQHWKCMYVNASSVVEPEPKSEPEP
jgi:hypothetical protein